MRAMAIYLDSNVLYPWRTFTELDRVAVSIVASQTKQFILVPWLVAEEAQAHYRRSLEGTVARLDSAISDVNRVFDELERFGGRCGESHPHVGRRSQV
jgi:hypothetical protein